MQYFEIIFGSMIMNNISRLSTNILWLDSCIIFLIIIGVYCSRDYRISNYIRDNIHGLIFRSNEKRISFNFKRGEQSIRCKALLHYLSNSNYKGSNVNNIVEDIFTKWDKYTDLDKEYANIYRVDQIKPFNFTNDIKGRVFTQEKETSEWNGKIIFKEFINLILYSESKSVKELQNFVEECKTEYNTFLKEQMLDNQYLITIENKECSKSDNNLKISKEEWKSNVTFNSRFFPKKTLIKETIDHFLNNEDWYKKKGLNHTLGILLSGEPGCGKTSFIKALMNHTKRHCIEVKLNDKFDFSDLKDIIYEEEIEDDLIVPQNKRIIVFEDIDAMGNVVKDRNLKQKENNEAEEKFSSEVLKLISEDDINEDKKSNISKVKSKINKRENNNLSYLLNILDGINETPGRIIIMTTNKPELLDEALVRPGRIDIRINFSKSTEEDVKNILNHYWKDEKDIWDKIGCLKELDKKFTPAEIVDTCRKSNCISESIKNLNLIVNEN